MSETTLKDDNSQQIISSVWLSFIGYVIFITVKTGYELRVFAIEEFGPIIHEFEPYFNLRTAEVR